MLWATNWPHPNQDEPLTADQLAHLAHRWLPDETIRRQVLVTNPQLRYDFAPPHQGDPT
jgi:predicted TIM-barrel fold metal-dependent hydrolase